jgi:hypothetical protein
MRQIWRADWLDPRRFDLCLNTDELTVEQGAAVVTRAALAPGGTGEAPAGVEPAPALSGAAAPGA